jgi:putative ABC transport system ATP-binding protein
MLVELSNVSRSYARGGAAVQAVDGVSLSLNAGEFVAVQGPSGCGKTTLLLVAGGLLRPDAGTVVVAGVRPYDLSSEGRAKFRAAKVGFVFQQFHLVPYLTVLENVLSPVLAGGASDLRPHAKELLDRFGLASRSDHTPGRLSSGERQRTALARALLHRPALLLADEPTGNLDPENADLVLTALRDCAREGAAVLLVTHDTQAAGRADRTIRLDRGRIVAQASGSPSGSTAR